MSMNIKNERAHELAREIADLTGESLTTAVTIALEERLIRVRREQAGDLVERILAIGRETAPLFEKGFRSTDHGDLLYDEDGLPK